MRLGKPVREMAVESHPFRGVREKNGAARLQSRLLSRVYADPFFLKRALGAISTAIEAATRMDREGILKRAQFESLYQRLFQVRDGIIVLMGELRAEWRRRYGT